MGSGGRNTIQSAEPYDEQMPYIEDIFAQSQALAQEDIPYYPGETFARSNALHDRGFSDRMNVSDQYGQMTNAAGQNVYNLATMAGLQAAHSQSPTVDPSNSLRQALSGEVNLVPYNQAAEAMINQTNRSVDSQVGQNDQAAALMGQSGSSRHGVAEGILRSNANAQLQDNLSNMYLGAYTNAQNRASQGVDQAVDLYSQGAIADASRMNTASSLFGQVPAFGQSQLGFAGVPLEAGDFYRNEQQTEIQDAVNRYNYQTQQPWNNLNRYAQLVWGAPGGTNSETMTTGTTSAIGSMAGGAMSGASAGAAMGGQTGGYLGAAIGAIAGLLLSED
ncbi:hypothetical protein A3193_18510 [Candidatus Thiodiazotropha endoloripes]|uniref:hypothetical protein n=1 Tax=Candidatus Thiodiazotropha endoloripes TaxID=1818881 RepID=UPI00083D51F1|nr:hypothetical protein [Candidatus Thiodiazotropha endoloripes]ODB82742.1 hypothetical protein A3193_18510 [Candidatus Thiodiazotropha endoloripes]